jgi:hypothetical protein
MDSNQVRIPTPLGGATARFFPHLADALAGPKLRSASDDRRSRICRPPRRQNRKVLARLVESGGFPCARRKTTDDHIDIEWVEFEPAANTPRRSRATDHRRIASRLEP